MKSLLIEGRYDSLVNQLIKKCVSVIKNSFEATKDGDGKYMGRKISFTQNETVPDIYQHEECTLYQEEVENAEIPLEFVFEFRLMWIQGLGEVECDGNAYNDGGYDSDEVPLVEALLQIDPDMFPGSMNEVIAELSDTIRHELEHLTQSG